MPRPVDSIKRTVRPGIDPCAPTTYTRQCVSCGRHRPDLPRDAEKRPATIVIDASALKWTEPRCPMWTYL